MDKEIKKGTNRFGFKNLSWRFFVLAISLSIVLAIFSFFPTETKAHPGRTDRFGGHHCWTRCSYWGYAYGQYHFHSIPVLPPLGGFTPSFTPTPSQTPSSYSLPTVSFGIVSQTGRVEAPEGQARELILVTRNMGGLTWTKDRVHLAVVDQNGQEGRIPSFLREPENPTTPSGWVSPNKVQMLEEKVKYGELATFKFWFKTPPGHPKILSKEYFRPEFDDVAQMENRGIFFEVVVP